MRLPRPNQASVPRYLVALVAVPLVLFALYDVHSQLPDNAVTLPGETTVAETLRKLAPQGWAFFTKSPQSGVLVPYQRTTTGHWESLHAGPNSAAYNAFGFDRASRAQGVEVALLLDAIPEKQWKDCGSSVAECLEQHSAMQPVSVKNISPDPTVCGDVFLVEQLPVKWAYTDMVPYSYRARQIVRLDASC